MGSRPYITIKIAQTFDGKIAAVGGKSRWITGPESRAFVHKLRGEHDAVLVGKNTFSFDHPRLSGIKPGNPVWKIVLASPELLPVRNARIFDSAAQVIFVVEKKDIKKWLYEPSLKKKPCLFLPVKKSGGKGYNLHDLMDKLQHLGVKKLLVEGGGEVFWSFLKNGLADKIYWMMAPKVLGGRTAKTAVEGEGLKDPNRALNLKIKRMIRLGKDYCFESTLLKTLDNRR